MLQYNLRGLLIPETIISSTLEVLENEFSVKMNDGNRTDLFNQYKQYCNELKALCEIATITQWVDGSYVTKSKNPSDIDLVSFIDFEVAKKKEKELKKFIYPESMETYGMDAYIIVVHPGDNKFNNITHMDRSYWIDRFGKTKPNRQKKRVPKGFLEIIV